MYGGNGNDTMFWCGGDAISRQDERRMQARQHSDDQVSIRMRGVCKKV